MAIPYSPLAARVAKGRFEIDWKLMPKERAAPILFYITGADSPGPLVDPVIPILEPRTLKDVEERAAPIESYHRNPSFFVRGPITIINRFWTKSPQA